MNRHSSSLTGYLAAAFCICVWGTTYISSKILLRVITPVELLLIRFVIGYLVLWIIQPKRLRTESLRDEVRIAACGLTGITLYYLLENVALTFTQASNVGVIIAAAPFFTALLSMLFGDKKRQPPRFYAGFVIAMAGICLLSFGGAAVSFHLKGDFLGFLAAVMWALYSILCRKVYAKGYPVIPTTRRMFFYGILFMIVPVLTMGFHPAPSELLRPVAAANLLFLGVVGCAVCFIAWNYAVRVIGAVKTSIFIYLTPVVTVISSVLLLDEIITVPAAAGIVMTLAGLLMSSDLALPAVKKRKGGLLHES
ncbi:MAG: DMT family transporter [Lachnospiraceae bacterium]|nr:DMT family transporter [Lachnospiraceae bacterium]